MSQEDHEMLSAIQHGSSAHRTVTFSIEILPRDDRPTAPGRHKQYQALAIELFKHLDIHLHAGEVVGCLNPLSVDVKPV